MTHAGDRILSSIAKARAWARGEATDVLVKSKYTFNVEWSDEDQEFVGTCAEFPSLSHLDPNREAALVGIKAMVRFARADAQETG